MKTKILSFFLTIMAVVGLSACHDDDWNPDISGGEGTVSLKSLGIDVSEGAEVIESRLSYDVSAFLVKIYDVKGLPVGSWIYSEMPEVFTLPAGVYTVEVESHKVEKAAWDKPYFKGSKEFTVVKNDIADIGLVTCKFANIKVSVRYSDALAELLGPDTKVEIVCNDEGMLTYTPAETRMGYFAAVEGSTTLVATFSSTIRNQKVRLTKTFSNIAPGQHRIITFTAKTGDGTIPDETGKIDLGSSSLFIDADVVTEEINGNISLEEDIIDGGKRPGTEESGEDPQPGDGSITMTPSSSLVFDPATIDASSWAEGTPAYVDIHSDNGFAHLTVSIRTTNGPEQEDFRAAVDEMVGLNFDLAYPGAREETYRGLGFPVSSDITADGVTDLRFDIGQFVPLMGAFSGTHNFTITAEDKNGRQEIQTLTFIVNQ